MIEDMKDGWLNVPDLRDKKKWGDGPWQTEPEEEGFEYKGYWCSMIRNSFGAWCGYVLLPEDHPFSKLESHLDIDNIEVHGGITYGQNVTLEENGRKGYMIGFDCAHYGDYIPTQKITNDFLKQECPSWPQLESVTEHEDIYRDIEFVRNEIKNMVDQIVVITLNVSVKTMAV
jgi:hypothetical protein